MRLLTLLIAGVFLGCQPTQETNEAPREPSSVVWLADETELCGLDFRHQSGHSEQHIFPEIMGGGVALFDMDNDGDLDAYFVQSGSLTEDSGHLNELYENDGSGKFIQRKDSGSEDSGYGMGVAAGDYDNDGDVDLYVTNVGPNVLLRNDGNGKFVDVTGTAKVGSNHWSTSAAFVDYDRDGFLDLYVCNYIHWSLKEDLRCNNGAGAPDYCNPTSYSAPERDSLFRNKGDGTFEDVSAKAGLNTSFGNGLGVVCGDLDQDGNTDIFVANDGVDNQCWMNQGDGRFIDRAMLTGCAVDKNGKAKAGMGTCAADIDDDGDLDLLVVNLQAQSDSFFRNEGKFFVDDTPAVGLGAASRPFTRFGVGWVDFDNDGRLDLFQANGRVTLPDQFSVDADPFAETNLLLRGMGKRFEALPSSAWPQTQRTSRAAAFGDIDNDGGIDVILVNKDGLSEVLMNRHPARGNFLAVRAVNQFGRDAVGASVEIALTADKRQRREINPHYSYLASNDPRAFFGLGDDSVNEVVVHWLDGKSERFAVDKMNQIIKVKYGDGRPTNDEDIP